jgi:hypothetical protein
VNLDKQLKDGSWEMDQDFDVLDGYAANYQKEWGKYKDQILPAMIEVLGLEFYQPVIDVPCAHWFKAQSTPLMMSFYYYPDQFVDVLTHELVHVLLTDNSLFSFKDPNCEVDLTLRWKKLFGEHEFTTLVHIPVHAVSKYIYLDVLKNPARFERDMKEVKDDAPYVAAWKYVNSNDYMQIIEQLKKDYQDLAKDLKT